VPSLSVQNWSLVKQQVGLKGRHSMAITRECLDDLLELARGWCREHLNETSVADVEETVQCVARAVGEALMEEALPALAGRNSYEGSSRPCECGRKAKFMGYRPRGIGTVFGVVTVERAYYYCKHCGTGHVPWDGEQGLSSLLWSPLAKGSVAKLAGRLPYRETVEVLEDLLGFRIEESGAERVVAEVGERLRDEEQQQAQAYCQDGVIPLMPQAPPRLYVSMDGTSAHVDGSWHEVKVGVVYNAKTGADGIDECSQQRYVAAQEPAQHFGERLYAAAVQAGVLTAQELIVIGDGAEWIWNIANHHYPGATEILDYWHVCEHIHELAKSYYGDSDPNGDRWAKDHCRWLKERGPGTLLGALKRMKPKTPAQADAVRKATGYFTNNRHRMQYHEYRKRRLMIGSGPAEASCKSMVQVRMKASGMRWSKAGADAVLAVRAAILSNDKDRVEAAAKAA
jgi:hypothetical protein